ncbi:MAG: Phosphatidylglycerophosphatase A [Syntrophaceae bacterium PtaU1.Bin231]|nr:MAG: Phosphatidylglycerophosphatase A [Syntrophaceae bacterium PtaU1.Bin231]
MPFAPGTAGTLVGIPVVLIFSPLTWPLQLLSVLALTCLACVISQEAEKIFQKKDAQVIVIDEIAGFCWTMLFVAPTVVHTAVGFVLFRVFDIAKPFPAGWVQRKWPGGLGVAGDDLVAGIYANVLLQMLIFLWGI